MALLVVSMVHEEKQYTGDCITVCMAALAKL